MAKTPEEIASRFIERRERALARSGAAMWPQVLATVVIDLLARHDPISRVELIEALEHWGLEREPLLKAGSKEAIARLREAIDERMRQRNGGE